jgi:hypothetical protein
LPIRSAAPRNGNQQLLTPRGDFFEIYTIAALFSSELPSPNSNFTSAQSPHEGSSPSEVSSM